MTPGTGSGWLSPLSDTGTRRTLSPLTTGRLAAIRQEGAKPESGLIELGVTASPAALPPILSPAEGLTPAPSGRPHLLDTHTFLITSSAPQEAGEVCETITLLLTFDIDLFPE